MSRVWRWDRRLLETPTVTIILSILACWSAPAAAAAVCKECEIVLGDVRVQALSPVLLRVEPKGPQGFEDRTTFMVASRAFEGLPITAKKQVDGTLMRTSHYTVLLKNGIQDFMVFDTEGKTVFQAMGPAPTLLHWPPPHAAQSYALADHPRFSVPSWGVAPACPIDDKQPCWITVDPGTRPTNGYDFRNNVDGDTYVFLLGTGLEGWGLARAAFAKLAGPVPLLPDFAFGTWFTRWYHYTESQAKSEVERWAAGNLPLDVWGLDVNWRFTSGNQDYTYDHPDTNAFPNMTEWLVYLKSKGLRTYFNDHPMPVAWRSAGGGQTSLEETSFRWNGLTEWLARGVTFWWFDRNWQFSIPPPNLDTPWPSGQNWNWMGLDHSAWGSHVYYTITEHYDTTVRDKMGDKWYGGRPISLTKFSETDWQAGMNPMSCQESPGHHRYPVWWTGDKVSLQASVESMVDAGIFDFKPYVHSDCGGDDMGTFGDFLRWTAHCAFGTIIRYHGSDHRPWVYGPHYEDAARRWLSVRYKLAPSIIAAGQRATKDGFPLVARGDLYWPELKEQSATNQQYIFIHDLLVAPIFDSKENMSSRQVWIPPGDWQDVWDGSIVSGPRTVTATQPWERQPMWHRFDGGLLILTDKPATRIDDQDWSSLTLEAFPCKLSCITERSLYERGSAARTDIIMRTDSSGLVKLQLSNSTDGRRHAWVLRFHLRAGQSVSSAKVDGKRVSEQVHVIKARKFDDGTLWYGFFPFGGAGAPPASKAGPVAELRLEMGMAREVELRLGALPEDMEMKVSSVGPGSAMGNMRASTPSIVSARAALSVGALIAAGILCGAISQVWKQWRKKPGAAPEQCAWLVSPGDTDRVGADRSHGLSA
mmetsp:Transcript_46842/g.102419  ORF Transcript_46842/g.102419 Transcript_46842/m.102419 type:complete len:871 (+) Transcript_46842:27-2639(+)